MARMPGFTLLCHQALRPQHLHHRVVRRADHRVEEAAAEEGEVGKNPMNKKVLAIVFLTVVTFLFLFLFRNKSVTKFISKQEKKKKSFRSEVGKNPMNKKVLAIVFLTVVTFLFLFLFRNKSVTKFISKQEKKKKSY